MTTRLKQKICVKCKKPIIADLYLVIYNDHPAYYEPMREYIHFDCLIDFVNEHRKHEKQ